MAGEGLFFTGTVFKNNRDLLKEEATRQQLAIQKEELELRKQQLADKKKEARRKGSKAQIKDYSVEGMDPFLVDQFQSQVGQYQGFANENAMAIYDGDNEAKNQQLSLERDLTANKSKYDSISNDLTSLNALVTAGKADNLKLTEDGEYLYEYNWNQVQEAVNSGEMDLDQALEAYPIDSQSMVNESEFEDHISAMFDAEADSREGSKSYTSEDGFSRSESFITDDQFSRGNLKAIKSLTPDSNGNWDNIDSKKIYIGKEGLFKVGDNMLSGPEAFALEVKGITSISDEDGSTPFLDKLMPGSGPEQEELRNEYIQYLAKKYEDQAKESYPPILGTSKKPTSKESSLSKDSISLLESPSEQLKNINNISVKLDDNKSAVVRDVTKVSVFLEDLQGVEGQNVGDKETTGTFLYNKNWYDSDSDSIEANLQRIALTEDNKPVAVMEYKGSSFLVPLGRLDSSLFKNKFEKGSTGAKIIEYSNLESSQQGGGATETLEW
jgi:hypothetical protein